MHRPETIEETAEMVKAAGGRGIAVAVDHLDPQRVRQLIERIESEAGALHILVNDVWGYPPNGAAPIWQADLPYGLRTVGMTVASHAITAHYAMPLIIKSQGALVVEISRGSRTFDPALYEGGMFDDLARTIVHRMAFALSTEVERHGGTSLSLAPGLLRTEAVLEACGTTEANWRKAVDVHPELKKSESPELLARGIVALATDPQVRRWNGQCLSMGELAASYNLS